uniref:LigA n=1 Tax=Parastrongyloides trichosuri TaxID=131310 RepID=A0A0N4Z5J4_PARTI
MRIIAGSRRSRYEARHDRSPAWNSGRGRRGGVPDRLWRRGLCGDVRGEDAGPPARAGRRDPAVHPEPVEPGSGAAPLRLPQPRRAQGLQPDAEHSGRGAEGGAGRAGRAAARRTGRRRRARGQGRRGARQRRGAEVGPAHRHRTEGQEPERGRLRPERAGRPRRNRRRPTAAQRHRRGGRRPAGPGHRRGQRPSRRRSRPDQAGRGGGAAPGHPHGLAGAGTVIRNVFHAPPILFKAGGPAYAGAPFSIARFENEQEISSRPGLRRGSDRHGGRLCSAEAVSPAGRAVRPRPSAPDPVRVRRPVGGQGQSEGLHRRRPRPLRGAGPRPAVRSSGAGKDDPGADRGARTGRGLPRHLRPHPGQGGRPGGHPDQPRTARRPVHRRNPPHGPPGGGDPLSGDGGPCAGPDHRRGAVGAQRAHRPGALHPGRGDDAGGPAGDAAARPLRHSAAAGVLYARRTDGGHPRRGAQDGRGHHRGRGDGDRTPGARHAAHRRASVAAGAGLCGRRGGLYRPAGGSAGAGAAGGGRGGAGQSGPPLPQGPDRELRRRASRHGHPGRRHRRSARCGRGRDRALPAATGLHPAHAARPHGLRPRL